MPITTSVFKKNPVSSSSLRGGGKSFSITTAEPNDGTTHRWRMNWVIPEADGKLDYESGVIEITKGTETFYSYDTEGNTQLSKLPAGLKTRIVDDFNTLSARTEQPEEEKGEMTETIVKTEEHHGVIIKLFMITNGLDIRAQGQTYWLVTAKSEIRNYNSAPYLTLAEAESNFEYQISWANITSDVGQVILYRDIEINYDVYVYSDGSPHSMEPYFFIQGDEFPREEFRAGDEVIYNDGFGTRNFGKITLNVDSDLVIIKEYIDARLTQRVDIGTVSDGLQNVYSWGWYKDNPDSIYNPFTELRIVKGFTIANTEGRILALDDDDLPYQESSAIHFKVKPNYRVRVTLMTQAQGYFTENISSLSEIAVNYEEYNLASGQIFNQSNDYVNTEKLTIDLIGGDEVSVSIDNEHGIKNFSITQSGVQLVKGAPFNIDDESFIKIEEVEFNATVPFSTPSSGQSGGNGDADERAPIGNFGLVIGAIAILIIIGFALKGNTTRGEEE